MCVYGFELMYVCVYGVSIEFLCVSVYADSVCVLIDVCSYVHGFARAWE